MKLIVMRRLEWDMSITRFNEGDIDDGLKCMEQPIRIFSEINDYYRFCYDNDNSKLFIELMFAKQHISNNENKITKLKRCISLLGSSKKHLTICLKHFKWT